MIYEFKKKITKDAEWFSIELEQANPNLKLKSRYISVGKMIEVECTNDGFSWYTTPKEVLRTNGRCPYCERKTFEQIKNDFITQLHKKNPNIELREEFKSISKKTLFRCNIHNYEWGATPSYVLKVARCPRCSNKKKTLEQFKEELKLVTSTIEVIDDAYNGSAEPIIVKCTKCGREWNGIPTYLLKGRGCLKCTKRGPKRKNQEDETK